MYCEKCGKEIENGSKFCEGCGEPVSCENMVEETAGERVGESFNASEPPVVNQTAINNEDNPQGNTQKVAPRLPKKKVSKKTIIAVACSGAAFIVLLVALVVGIKLASRININDYITVEFSGMNTKGKASVEFDTTAFEEAVAKQYKGDKPKSYGEDDNYGEDDFYDELMNADKYEDYYDFLYEVEDCITCELDKSEDLTNGDVVTVKINCDEETLKENRIGYKFKDIAYSVEGLKDGTRIDVFKDINVIFDGVSPYATAKIENNSEDKAVSGMRFELDRNNGLKIGDSVTITMYCSDEYLEENLLIPESDTKTYEVKEIPKYAVSESDIPDEDLEQIKKRADELADLYFAKRHDDSEWFGSILMNNSIFTYLSGAKKVSNVKTHAEFFANKTEDFEYADRHNILVISYTFDITDLGGTNYKNACSYVSLKNITVNADGTLNYEDDDITVASKFFTSTKDFDDSVTNYLKDSGYTVNSITVE